MSPKVRLAVVLSVVYIDMLGIGLAFPVLPRLIEQFEGGDISLASYIYGGLAAAYSAMQFLCAPLIGVLSDRYGRRPVILLALVGMGVNYFLLAFAPSLWLFALGRMIAGAFGATFTAAGAYLADITPPEKRAQSFGLLGAAFGFGFITGPALGGVLGGVDLRLPFVVAACLSLADFAFAFFALPESLAPENRKPLNLKFANPVGALREIGRYPRCSASWRSSCLRVCESSRRDDVGAVHVLPVPLGSDRDGMVARGGRRDVRGRSRRPRARDRAENRRAPRNPDRADGERDYRDALRNRAPGWMVLPFMVLAAFGWTIAQPAVQALMSRSVPANEQGLLQGALSSMMNLTSIVGPPISTGLCAFICRIRRRSSCRAPRSSGPRRCRSPPALARRRFAASPVAAPT